MEKPRLSSAQIWNMSFGFLGIQFGWTLPDEQYRNGMGQRDRAGNRLSSLAMISITISPLRRLLAGCKSPFAAGIFTAALLAQQPSVVKVEPPNWWAGHSINPVRLLVRGSHLEGASVDAPRGLHRSRVKVNTAGTYLFVNVEIGHKTSPGDIL